MEALEWIERNVKAMRYLKSTFRERPNSWVFSPVSDHVLSAVRADSHA